MEKNYFYNYNKIHHQAYLLKKTDNHDLKQQKINKNKADEK